MIKKESKVPGNSGFRMICLTLFFSFGAMTSSMAQSSSLEFWPEIDIWYRLNPSWRLSTFLPLTKNVESKYREFNIYLQADYAWGRTKFPFYKKLTDDIKAQNLKGWMSRGGFMEGWSLGDHGENYTEDMFFLEIHRRVPLKGDVLLSNRIRTDLRWIGKDPEFSYRIRYRIMFEKEYSARRSSIVPYINAEPYWDSRYSTFSRIRVIGGATMSWEPRLALEGNFTYQHDSKSAVTNVYALNIILHLFFEENKKKST